jgi:hypothetical protein
MRRHRSATELVAFDVIRHLPNDWQEKCSTLRPPVETTFGLQYPVMTRGRCQVTPPKSWSNRSDGCSDQVRRRSRLCDAIRVSRSRFAVCVSWTPKAVSKSVSQDSLERPVDVCSASDPDMDTNRGLRPFEPCRSMKRRSRDVRVRNRRRLSSPCPVWTWSHRRHLATPYSGSDADCQRPRRRQRVLPQSHGRRRGRGPPN